MTTTFASYADGLSPKVATLFGLALIRFRLRRSLVTAACVLLGMVISAFGTSDVPAQPVSNEPKATSLPAVAPAWAYPNLGPNPPSPPNDGVRHTLDGSPHTFTMVELFDLFTARDWFADSHPPMPEVVAHGRKPEVRACGMCHYPNGQGRPENAPLAGQTANYIFQQIKDYQSGARRSSNAQAGPHLRMLATAQNVSDEELQAAAAYFASMKYRPWIKVIEVDRVPLTQVVTGSMLAAVPGDATEPIGQRLIEVPTDFARTELRDSRSGFTAYVPVGSIARGKAIATSGATKGAPCVSCHGADLRGVGDIPPLAGRSAQYLFRQLFDIRKGTRAGAGAVLMNNAIGELTLEDMVAVIAYASSREP